MHSCTQCGAVMRPKRHTPGGWVGFIIELFWWVFGLASIVLSPLGILALSAAIGFSVYRYSASKLVCSECSSPYIVKVRNKKGGSHEF